MASPKENSLVFSVVFPVVRGQDEAWLAALTRDTGRGSRPQGNSRSGRTIGEELIKGADVVGVSNRFEAAGRPSFRG